MMLAREFNLSTEETDTFLHGHFARAILPEGAYVWFALPVIEAAARHCFPAMDDPEDRYRHLTELALKKISERFEQFGSLDCKSTPEKFFLPEKTRQGIDAIRAMQVGSILVVPVGFGSQASQRVQPGETFPLGSFFTACLALTHGERYAPPKPTPVPDGGVECIGFGPVGCRTCWFDDARVKWERATGFVPRFQEDLP